MSGETSRFFQQPLVSVVTPVHNGEPYLRECIESVLGQSYSNFEHIIVDNCSTDGSIETAELYAGREDKIRIIRTDRFLSQVENYNYALRTITPDSTYCKILAADDRIFPTCLERMVNIMERDPSVGVVGAFTLLDYLDHTVVYLTGLPCQQEKFSGRDICRRFLLDGLYVFGSPTATLIRSEIVRNRVPFYYEDSVTEDVDPFFEILQSWDFGFAHEVLTYHRRYNSSTMSVVGDYGLHILSQLVEITLYGRHFLEEKEYLKCRRKITRDYRLMLGHNLLRHKFKAFWDFHKRGLHFAGRELSVLDLAEGALCAMLDLTLNPKSSLQRIVAWRGRYKSS